MTPPRRLYRVEWSACRHPSRPWDRLEQSRNFTSAHNAAGQVLAIRMWEPHYMELLGVWVCNGGRGALDWQPVDPASLPVNEDAAIRAQLRAEHSIPYHRMMEMHT